MPPADLAARLAESPGFRWCEGMRAADTRRVCWVDDASGPGGILDYDMRVRAPNCVVPMDARIPDLLDHATGGCLLAMLVEATDRDCYATPLYGGGWQVYADGSEYEGSSLGEACAAALLACWGAAKASAPA